MAPLPYEFDRKRKSRNAFPWRLVALFCAVGLLTAGGLYFLYPKAAPVDAPLPPPQENPAPAPAAQDPVPTAASGDKTSVLPQEPDKTGKSPDPAPAEPEAVTELPVKGKPWVGDPPPAQDQPVVPENRPPADSGSVPAAPVAAPAVKNSGDLPTLRDSSAASLAAPAMVTGSRPWREAAAQLTQANRQLWAAAPANDSGTTLHVVKSGDTLLRIADHYHTTAAAVRTPNQIPANSNIVRIGQRLRLVAGPWSVRISKSLRLLEVYRGEGEARRLFVVFDVGIGRLNSTPNGEFVVYDRCRANLSPEFGRSYLKLAQAATPDRPFAGAAIHGTDDEHSVTRSQSAGCIRLRNDDMDFLYAVLPLRTPVTVTE